MLETLELLNEVRSWLEGKKNIEDELVKQVLKEVEDIIEKHQCKIDTQLIDMANYYTNTLNQKGE